MKYSFFSLVLLILFFSCSPKKVTKEKELPNPDYDKAFDFRQNNMSDSAFKYFNISKGIFLQRKDSLGAAKCLVNMAIISNDKGDYFGSEEISTEALTYFDITEKKQFVYLNSVFQELGIASSYLKNYKQAITFYNKSILYADNLASIQVTKNSVANAYGKIRDYKKSFAVFGDILNQKMSDENFARTLSNFAFNKWKQNSKYNAAPELLKALSIRLTNNDFWGQNASYSHLADYYLETQPASALVYASKMYSIAQKIQSPDDRLEALRKLIRLSPIKDTKKLFGIYRQLDDSLQISRNAAKNQFALIRYEAEKNKADNLILQKENGEKKYQIIIITSVALFILVGGIFWYRKRKRDIEIKSQKAITDSKLKTSKKVHDVVANGLYRVMTEIENQQDLDRNHVLDKIEDLYEKSRDISYEKPTEANKPFHEILSEILTSFATENRKVLIAGNDAELWRNVSKQIQYELEHIIQELMVNMKKHSQASNVVMRFENNDEQIKIYYTDNGVGMPKEKEFNNGLRNTGNRIEEINGAIIFDTEVEKGLKIQISFPIS